MDSSSLDEQLRDMLNSHPAVRVAEAFLEGLEGRFKESTPGTKRYLKFGTAIRTMKSVVKTLGSMD